MSHITKNENNIIDTAEMSVPTQSDLKTKMLRIDAIITTINVEKRTGNDLLMSTRSYIPTNNKIDKIATTPIRVTRTNVFD